MHKSDDVFQTWVRGDENFRRLLSEKATASGMKQADYLYHVLKYVIEHVTVIPAIEDRNYDNKVSIKPQ